MTSDRMTELRQAVATGTRAVAIAAADELIAEIRKCQRRRDAAKGPKLSEVCTYAQSKGRTLEEASDFWNRYEATGWKYGNTKIVKWENAFNRWKGNGFNAAPANGKPAGSIGSRFGVGA